MKKALDKTLQYDIVQEYDNRLELSVLGPHKIFDNNGERKNMSKREAIEKKLIRSGREGLVRELGLLKDKQAIDSRILRNAKEQYVIAESMAEDDEVTKAKELLKYVKSPYVEALSVHKDIAKLLNIIAEERGYAD